MSLTSGFFNSSNHDRMYDADDMSRIFDGVIADGVYTSIGECFSVIVSPDDDESIIVKPGRAWFNHTWTFLDEAMPIELPPSDVLLDRIDTVILKVDATLSVRENSIEIKEGTASSSPVEPTLTHTDFVNEYPLADIYRKAATDTVTQADITYLVGTERCPFVKGVVETVSTDILLQQWQAEFRTWFEHMKGMVDEDLGMRLQNEIDTINSEKPVIAFYDILNNSDLDDYTTPGMYRNPLDANTIENAPINGKAFHLIVLSIGTNYATQIVVTYDTGKMYVRNVNTGVWTQWMTYQPIKMVMNGTTLEITTY